MGGATRSLFGIDADLWTAVGAVAVPIIIAGLGIWWGRFQQQSQWASDRFSGGRDPKVAWFS
jgi:hypothetical protein